VIDDDLDPLIGRLQVLLPARPRPEHDLAVRARCRAALVSARRTARARSRQARVVDASLAIAVGIYGIAVMAEAARLILR
jgi:hypothetical protein